MIADFRLASSCLKSAALKVLLIQPANPTRRSLWIVQVQRTQEARTTKSANPTRRQSVDRSSPAYTRRPLDEICESHQTAVCGSFKSSLQKKATRRNRESHKTAVCGSFKSNLHKKATRRNRESHKTAVCGSFKSNLHKKATRRNLRIPQDGSLWIVQVQPNSDSMTFSGLSVSWLYVGRPDLNDPPTAVRWDSQNRRAYFFVGRT
jgi:hypothetical protein